MFKFYFDARRKFPCLFCKTVISPLLPHRQCAVVVLKKALKPVVLLVFVSSERKRAASCSRR